MRGTIAKLLFTLTTLISVHSMAQMVLEVNAYPQLTPLLDDIYVAGTFNDWNPADENYKLTLNNGVYSISISGNNGDTYSFKFTRGVDWQTVEGNETGAYIPDRTLMYQSGTTATFQIAGWEDIPGNHTITDRVRILDMDFAIPQLNRTRRIWITLPEDYENTSLNYPVLYLQDGQNIFDNATSFSGEWQVDEALNGTSVPECVEPIVVAIDNGGAARIDEYSPWLNTEYNEGGEGALYGQFIVETLKPYIDAHFRTIPDKAHTAIGGSSLGALISMYILAAHHDTFSKAALFSPAFWFNPELNDYLISNPLPMDTEIFFICGDAESNSMVSDMQQIRNTILAAGNPESQMHYQVQGGGQHNEYWWSVYTPTALSTLYTCINSVVELPEGHVINLYPNPAHDSIHITINKGSLLSVAIKDQKGKIIREESLLNNGNLDVSNLASGLYLIQCSYRPQNTWTAVSCTTFFVKD